MKLLSIFVLFILVSCVQEEGYKLVKAPASSNNALEADDEHNESGGLPLNTQLVVASEMQVKAELYDSQSFVATISASPEFEGGEVALSVDRSVIDGEGISAAGYINFIFSENPITLTPGEQKQVTVRMVTRSMAPSFKSKLEDGLGEIKIVASTDSERGEFSVAVGVDPIITVEFISPGNFRIGQTTIADDSQIPVRPHEGGVELRSLYAQDFGQAYRDATNDPGPCLHLSSGGGITHCNTGQDLPNVGDMEVHGRVMPGINKSTPFYDHNQRNGYTGTINFNQTPLEVD